MAKTPFRRILLPLFSLGIISICLSQNLVPNPDFETFTSCPVDFNQGQPLECIPWDNATNGTADYLNACSSGNVDVPNNWFGHQDPRSGVAYGGFILKWDFMWREYLQVQLTQPLVAGYSYDIEFYVSLADNMCATPNIGIYFSATPPSGNTVGVLPVTPQFESDLGYITDKDNWTLISGCYAAEGGEQYITIGNFYDDADTPLDPNCSISNHSYYYVEDVSITQGDLVNTLDLDLGDDVVACVEYEIESGVDNVEYEWSTGSTDPSIIVTETGMYVLTISDGCDRGVDSVYVFFDGVPDGVEIGPPEVTICNGDSYDINLDPDLGDYEWQDGSTDPDYSITTPGLYQVSFNDGCDVTTDEINVLVMDIPEPFTLGGDAYLCPGDEIEFSFDPALGDFHWQDGSTDPDYVIDIGGYYELSISNMCGEYVDDIEVVEIPLPEVELGPNQLQICEGQVINYNFNANLGEYLWQDGTDSELYTISGPGNYSVTMTNDCGSTSDQIVVTLQSAPVFDLGEDITICPAQLPVTLDVGNATNASFFQWQDGSTNTQFQVTTGGSFSVTVSNDCFSIADQIDVVLQDSDPVVELPPDQTLCPGQTFLLDASGFQGNYTWQDNSTSSTFIVNQEGTYSLSVTNQCGTGSDSVFINYTDSISPPDLGADVNLCPGEQYVFYAGIPGVNYLWQDGSSADSLLVPGAGTYALTISDACTSAADTVAVTISNNPPQVNLPASLSLCQSDTLIVDPGISGVQFLWSDGSSSSTLSITNPGAYSLTISNSCGLDADTIQILDAGPAPSIDLGQDISLCSGDVSLIQPVSSGVNSWLWQDGSSSPTYTASGPGTITVQAINGCGVSYDTLVVSSLPDVPLLQLGSDTALCPGETFTLNISLPGVNILWSDGSTSTDFDVTGPGSVYASISNVCGSSSDTIDITSLPTVPALDLGIDQSLCPGDVITLSPGIPGVSYVWQDGSTAQTFNATQAGTIILTVSNVCGFTSDTVIITESTSGPQVDLGPDILECEGTVVTLNSGISGVSYLWQDGSTSPDFIADVTGTYILQVSNSCGVDNDTIQVEISGVSPQPDLGKDTLLCEGETLTLNANPDTETSVVWQNGSTSPTFTVTSAGSYNLAASNRCGNASDTINVAYEAAPAQFNLGPDTTLCPGESILLNAPQSNLNITWQDGSHGLNLIADHALLYTLQLSNDCGTSSDDLLVSVDTRMPVVDAEPIPWCEGDVITLDVSQSFSANYLWNDGSVTPVIQVDAPGIYGVQVSTDCQSVQQDIEVVPGEDCKNDVYVPTVFTPNGDGVNDVFTISIGSDLEVISLSCSVFDRWGNMVYNAEGLNFAWDGRFQENELLPGVYVYQIILDYISRNEPRNQIFSGDVTLIR